MDFNHKDRSSTVNKICFSTIFFQIFSIYTGSATISPQLRIRIVMKGFLLILLFFCFSCGKPDLISPVITLASPQENQVFTAGQTVTVKATITDNEGIHMVHLIVLDKSNNGHMVHFEDHFDGKTYELEKTFPALAGKSFSIEIDATDHNENVTKKELTISVN